TLWVAFALPLLGGAGLDHLSVAWPGRIGRWWLSLGLAAAAALGAGAIGASSAEPWLRAKAEGHYLRAVGTSGNEGLDAASALGRADRQVRAAVGYVPRVLSLTALEIAALGALAVAAHRGKVPWPAARMGVLALTLAELFRAAYGLNPAIDRGD